MKKLAIIIYDITHRAGTERVASNLANEFVFLGLNVDIISISMTNKIPGYNLDKKIKLTSLGFDECPKKHFRTFIYHFKIYRKLKKLLKEKHYDKIISTWVTLNIVVSYITKQNLIACEHINYSAPSIIWKFFRILRYRKIYKVVSLTNQDKEHYLKIGANVVTIPNWIENQTDISLLYNKKLLAVGRLSYQKGFDILLDIIYMIKDKLNGWTLDIIGEGELRDILRKKIYDLGLENIVFLKGQTDNIKKYYLNSSVFLMTSRFEGFPMVLLEAKNYGLPCIAFDCKTGPKDIIKNFSDGFLIREGDKVDFSNKLLLLLSDQNLLKSFSSKSKENIVYFYKENIRELWRKII